jgi:hypothetical protein
LAKAVRTVPYCAKESRLTILAPKDWNANSMPEHSLNAVIRHVVTGEEGRIVRIVEAAETLRTVEADRPAEAAYIVSLPAGRFVQAREALWFRSEVETSVDGDGRSAADSAQVCWVCGKDVRPEDRKLDTLGKPVHLACHESEYIPINI